LAQFAACHEPLARPADAEDHHRVRRHRVERSVGASARRPVDHLTDLDVDQSALGREAASVWSVRQGGEERDEPLKLAFRGLGRPRGDPLDGGRELCGRCRGVTQRESCHVADQPC
jgi:hypothetical protein